MAGDDTRSFKFVVSRVAEPDRSGHQPIAERFPNIRKACAEMGVDIERDPIPVVPAAHYFCGGVLADTSGRSTLSRLYAIGETSCTGVHLDVGVHRVGFAR